MGFTLTILSPEYVVTWNFHVDESTKARYNMIIRRYLLIELLLNLKLSDHATKSDYVIFKGSKEPMVYLGAYEFKDLNTRNITPEELTINYYA